MNTISFDETFKKLVSESRELYGTFSTIASVLVFAGLVSAAANGTLGELTKALRGLVTAALVIVMVGIFPRLTDLGQDIVHSLVTGIGADPSESHQKFAHLIAGPETAGEGRVGFFDILWNSDNGGIGKAMLYAVLLLLGKIAYVIMWIAFLVQKLVVLMGVAVAPVFLAMLTLDSTRSIAGKYFLTLVALISWPFGWAMADIVTSGLLRMSEDTSTFFLILILSIWIPISTIAAPFAIHMLLVHGAQIGGSLLQSVGMATSQGVSYGLGGGVSASLSGSGRATTALAAAAGAVGGTVSGAAGSTGVLIPGMIGVATIAASSPKKPEREAQEMAERMRLGKL